MSKPVRVQLSRARGWRLPPNTVVVARPTKWGNPHKVCAGVNAALAVQRFREDFGLHPEYAGTEELRGKNLACWCPLIINGCHNPCHADVLLELANK